MGEYVRKVQYYETDRMGIVHHANYVRWMEEARIDFMERIGFPYAQMEAQGVLSPVRSVSCRYLRPCTFGDEVRIGVRVEGFNGVVLTLGYDMYKGDGERVFQGGSEHVFTRKEGGILRLKRDLPEFSAALEALANVGEGEQ